jgi:hypothetical protein
MSKEVRDPQTPEEWQEAADTAHILLAIEAARGYGLVTGGPELNEQRCIEILLRAEALGYKARNLL